MHRRDHYDLLGVPRDAPPADIRRAYRRLARQYSPDVNLGDVRAAGFFEEIQAAYQILSDPTRRTLYDRLGRGDAEPPAPETGTATGARGEDLHYPIDLDLEQALRGLTAVLALARHEACEGCGATGGTGGRRPTPCPTCEGRPGGGVRRGEGSVSGRCPLCAGTGWRKPVPCEACGGRGVVPRRARIAVTIPPGVDTGTQIRVPGQGHAAPAPGRAGDLVVAARVRPHPFFTRKGDNLHCEVPVSVPEAALGARLHIPTPDGGAVITIPSGTQSGQVLRVRGKGCPRLDRDAPGDLFVSVRVTIPRNADTRLEEVLRMLERLLPDDPRANLWRPRH